jgi:Rrf2 family protein
MMSKRCKYAIKALIELSPRFDKGYMATSDIASKANIPKKFLEQILLDLKRAKLVGSRQGIGGGYYLLKHPKDISVADVYRLFDGAIALVPCVSINFYETCSDCPDEKECTMRMEFIRIREGARQVMSKISIQSFLKPKKIRK